VSRETGKVSLGLLGKFFKKDPQNGADSDEEALEAAEEEEKSEDGGNEADSESEAADVRMVDSDEDSDSADIQALIHVRDYCTRMNVL